MFAYFSAQIWLGMFSLYITRTIYSYTYKLYKNTVFPQVITAKRLKIFKLLSKRL